MRRPFIFRGFGELAPGSTGGEVEDWQANLKELGYPVVVSGIYDDGATWSATVNFKLSVGLPGNGVVDIATVEAMGKKLDELNGPLNPIKKMWRMDPIDFFGRLDKSWLILGAVAAVGGWAYLRSR